MLYHDTLSFIRASTKAAAKLSGFPDSMTKTNYAKADLIANARAYLTAAQSVGAAAATILSQLDPPPPDEVHHHYPNAPQPRPPLGGAERPSTERVVVR